MNLIQPILLQTADSAEPPLMEFANSLLLRADAIVFEDLLIGMHNPSADNMHIAASPASQEAATRNSALTATLPAPTRGNEHTTLLSIEKTVELYEKTAADNTSSVLPLTRKPGEKEAENPRRVEKMAALSGDIPVNSFLHTMSKTPVAEHGAAGITDIAQWKSPDHKEGEGNREFVPDKTPPKNLRASVLDYTPAQTPIAEKDSFSLKHDTPHLTIHSPVSNDLEKSLDTLYPSPAPKTILEPDVRRSEHPSNGGNTGDISPVFESGMAIAAAFPGEELQVTSHEAPHHQTSSTDRALRLSLKTGVQYITREEPDNASPALPDGRNNGRTTPQISQDGNIFISKQGKQQETLNPKVIILQNLDGDNARQYRNVSEKTLVAFNNPQTVNDKSESFTDADITSVIIRKMPEADREFQHGSQQSQHESRKPPMPAEARATYGSLSQQSETGTIQENIAEASPSNDLEPPRAPDDPKNNLLGVTKKGDASLELHVDTDSAGELKIELVLNRGVLHAQIQTSDEFGKNMIERNLSGLIQSLIHEGLQVGNFSVFLKEKGNGTNNDMKRDDSENSRMAPDQKPRGNIPMDRLVSIFV